MGCFTSKQDVSEQSAIPAFQPLPLTSPSFTLFSSLPPELRLKIWSFTSLEPRNILIRHSISATCLEHPRDGWEWTCRPRCLNPLSVPSVLHTTRESRAQALMHYNLKFGTPVPLALDLEYGIAGYLVWNGAIFNTPGLYINVAVDRICLLQAEVKLLGRQRRYKDYPYMCIVENSQRRGIAAFIKEAAANGTKYLGLMGVRDGLHDSVLQGPLYSSTIPQDLGPWDSPPFTNTSLEDVLFFTRPEDLDIPKSRGTWRINVPYYSIPLENLVNEEAGLDAGKLLASAKERVWLSAFNGRVVEYRPREGERKWPNIGYTLIE